MTYDGERTALLGLVINAVHLRAAHYWQQAARLREIAEIESIERVRDSLLDVATPIRRASQRAGAFGVF